MITRVLYPVVCSLYERMRHAINVNPFTDVARHSEVLHVGQISPPRT